MLGFHPLRQRNFYGFLSLSNNRDGHERQKQRKITQMAEGLCKHANTPPMMTTCGVKSICRSMPAPVLGRTHKIKGTNFYTDSQRRRCIPAFISTKKGSFVSCGTMMVQAQVVHSPCKRKGCSGCSTNSMGT